MIKRNQVYKHQYRASESARGTHFRESECAATFNQSSLGSGLLGRRGVCNDDYQANTVEQTVINRNHDNRARRTLDELTGIFIHIAPLQPTPYILLGILMYVRGATRPTLWPLMRSSIIIIHLHLFTNINTNIIDLYLSCVCIAQPLPMACVSLYPRTCVFIYKPTYVYVCICCLYTAGHRTRRGRVTSLHVPHSVVYKRR
jgi:hypothetical protein